MRSQPKTEHKALGVVMKKHTPCTQITSHHAGRWRTSRILKGIMVCMVDHHMNRNKCLTRVNSPSPLCGRLRPTVQYMSVNRNSMKIKQSLTQKSKNRPMVRESADRTEWEQPEPESNKPRWSHTQRHSRPMSVVPRVPIGSK